MHTGHWRRLCGLCTLSYSQIYFAFFFLFHRSQSSFRRDDSFATGSLTGGFASIIISRMDGIRPSYFRPRVESTFSMRNQFLVILSTAGSFFFSDIRLTIHKVGDTVLLSSTIFSRRVFYDPSLIDSLDKTSDISSFQFFRKYSRNIIDEAKNWKLFYLYEKEYIFTL